MNTCIADLSNHTFLPQMNNIIYTNINKAHKIAREQTYKYILNTCLRDTYIYTLNTVRVNIPPCSLLYLHVHTSSCHNSQTLTAFSSFTPSQTHPLSSAVSPHSANNAVSSANKPTTNDFSVAFTFSLRPHSALHFS